MNTVKQVYTLEENKELKAAPCLSQMLSVPITLDLAGPDRPQHWASTGPSNAICLKNKPAIR